MAENSKENRKKQLKDIALAAFLLSLGAGSWFVIALLSDLMNPKLLSFSYFSYLPPIALSVCMYVFCKYVEKKAAAIVTEREEEVEQRRRALVAAITNGARTVSIEKSSES